jgi:hypothetical protein
MPTEFKEIIVDPDALDTENLRPDTRQHMLFDRARRDVGSRRNTL